MAFVTSFAAYDAMVSEESKQVGQQVDGKYVNGCSDHKSSARPKKKGKQKKVPQRELGVAQLERMRMEELKKKEVGSSSSSLMVPVARGVTVPTSNSNYDIPVPSFNFCPILPDSTVPPTWEFTTQVVSVDSSEPLFGIGYPPSGDQPVLVGSSLAADQKPLPYHRGQEKVSTMVALVDVCVNIFILVLFLVMLIVVCKLINVFHGFCCAGECFIYKLMFFWRLGMH